MFGKLIDNTLYPAPPTLTIDGHVHYHPSDSLYMANGYLPVVDTPYPEIQEDSDPIPYYESQWEIQDEQIIKVWVEATPPETPATEPTLEDRVITLEASSTEMQEALDMILNEVTE